MKQRQQLQDYMTSELIAQLNYIIYFHIRGSFFNNKQGLFLLSFGYVIMVT